MEHLVVEEVVADHPGQEGSQMVLAKEMLAALDSTTELAAAAAVPVVQVPTVQIGRT
jgi:hypothetical protein